MTVTYHSHHSSTNLQTFLKLLARWRGSVYKLIYKEFLIFAILYATVSIFYRFALFENDSGQIWTKKHFEAVALMCNQFIQRFPLTFMLGFYVTAVVGRWWEQVKSIPWPDNEADLLLRRKVARQLVLSLILRLREMGVSAQRRFPTIKSIVNEGFMTEREATVYTQISKTTAQHWIPCQWIMASIVKAKNNGHLSEYVTDRLLWEIKEYMKGLRWLFMYGTISIPLVYTQAVTLSVYAYFLAMLFARQYLTGEMDLYVPFFSAFEFVLYLGWLKVAETMMNPFGEDDEDFEVNWFINRHSEVCQLIVDKSWDLAKSLNDSETVTNVTQVETKKMPKLSCFYNNFWSDSTRLISVMAVSKIICFSYEDYDVSQGESTPL